MNNLSIAIYLADVIPSLGNLFGFLLFTSGFIMLFATFAYFMSEDIGEKDKVDTSVKIFRWAAVVFCVSFVLNTIIPKRDTIMMITASEFGESVLKSDDVKEIINPAKQILKNWINDQLTQSEKKK